MNKLCPDWSYELFYPEDVKLGQVLWNMASVCLCICLCIWWFAPVSPAVQRHIMTTSCQAATCSTPHPPNPCVTLCDCGRAANILPLPFNQFPTSNPSSLIPEVPNNPATPPTDPTYYPSRPPDSDSIHTLIFIFIESKTEAFAIRWPAQFQTIFFCKIVTQSWSATPGYQLKTSATLRSGSLAPG